MNLSNKRTTSQTEEKTRQQLAFQFKIDMIIIKNMIKLMYHLVFQRKHECCRINWYPVFTPSGEVVFLFLTSNFRSCHVIFGFFPRVSKYFTPAGSIKFSYGKHVWSFME